MANPNKGLKPDMVSQLLRVAAPVERSQDVAGRHWIAWHGRAGSNEQPPHPTIGGPNDMAYHCSPEGNVFEGALTLFFHLLLIVMIRCLLQSSRSETVRT